MAREASPDKVVDWGGDDEVTVGGASAIGNPYMFTSRRLDTETGFYQFRTRYYDPDMGRFISRDTIGIWGDEGSLGNGYAYAGNNPVSNIDPDGEGWKKWKQVKKRQFKRWGKNPSSFGRDFKRFYWDDCLAKSSPYSYAALRTGKAGTVGKYKLIGKYVGGASELYKYGKVASGVWSAADNGVTIGYCGGIHFRNAGYR